MLIRKTIIEDRIDECIVSYGDAADVAFMKLTYSIIERCGYDELQPEEVVDGGQDKQMDVLSIQENLDTGTADILILQTKNEDSFSSNALTLLGNGLSWVFEKNKAQYSKLKNIPLVRQIDEVRDLRNRLGPSNLRLRVLFVTKGDAQRLSDEFKQEMGALHAKYGAAGFGHFEIAAIGSSELVDMLADEERRERQVDDTLPIVYDVNKASYIQYTSQGLTGYICTVKGSEIARLVSGDREKVIFDLNLRRFYGLDRGRVNPSIAATSSSPDESHLFWFFNNGITLVCDDCDLVPDPDTAHVKLTNLQIVNGCQTSMTLAEIAKAGHLQEKVEVLVKIFKTDNDGFVDKVVLTTNNQNAINSRDLKANDDVQTDYQRAFAQLFDIRYERKPREYKGLTREETRSVVSNEKVAQAYLAIVRKKPTISRTQKYRVWDDEWYRNVFPHESIERHVLAYLIYDYCLTAKKAALVRWKDDAVRYSVVSYGVFHLARVLAYKYTGKEDWNDLNECRAFIAELRANPKRLDKEYGKSVTFLAQLIRRRKDWLENINNAFKAADIEAAMNKGLHKLKAK